MSAIPRAVREQIEALLTSCRAERAAVRGSEDRETERFYAGAAWALARVVADCDAHDAAYAEERRAHFERDDVP